jgi:hypothetical protein
MTIIVAVGCPEGIAVASDSRETYPVPGGLGVYSDEAQKLFLLGEEDSATRVSPCVVAWTGRSVFLDRTIEEHLRQFALSPPRSPLGTPRTVAAALIEYFEPRILEDMRGVGDDGGVGASAIEFLIAGYEADQPRVLQVSMPPGAVYQRVPHAIAWLGTIRPLSKALLGRAVSSQELIATRKRALETAHLNLDGAAELATFGVELTIGIERFTGNRPGLATKQGCGGPVRLAIADRSGRVSWVSRGNMFLSARSFLPPYMQRPATRRRQPKMIRLPWQWEVYDGPRVKGDDSTGPGSLE